MKREEILDGAVSLLDEGLSALTMRSLAGGLGVTTAALYYWFPAKSDLLDGVADHLAEQIVSSAPKDGAWQERIEQICRSVTSVADEHPGAFAWLFTNYVRKLPLAKVDEELLDALCSGGFDYRGAVLARGTILRFVVGHLALDQAPARMDPGVAPVGDYPRVHQVAGVSAQQTRQDFFEAGLHALIAGLVAAKEHDR